MKAIRIRLYLWEAAPDRRIAFEGEIIQCANRKTSDPLAGEALKAY